MLTRYRSLAVPLAILAAAVLFYLVNPWFFPAVGSTERGIASIVFWVLMILVLALLFEDRKAPQAETVEVEGPAFTRYLFSNTRAGLIWLPIRLFLGFEWLTAGWDKLTGTGWVDGGASLLGYWKSAVAVPATGHAAITFEWYRSFLQLLINNNAQTWFGWLITLGAMAIGIGLLLGILTGIAAFFGATMNMSYLLGRLDLHKPGDVCLRNRPDPGLEGGWLLRRGSLPPAAPGSALGRSLGSHLEGDQPGSNRLTIRGPKPLPAHGRRSYLAGASA
jgi:uncharacterized membrane protein YphA (DoxX/SURF4 family)